MPSRKKEKTAFQMAKAVGIDGYHAWLTARLNLRRAARRGGWSPAETAAAIADRWPEFVAAYGRRVAADVRRREDAESRSAFCPSCGNPLPPEPTQQGIATSRFDGKIDICSACGTAEALDDFAHALKEESDGK